MVTIELLSGRMHIEQPGVTFSFTPPPISYAPTPPNVMVNQIAVPAMVTDCKNLVCDETYIGIHRIAPASFVTD